MELELVFIKHYAPNSLHLAVNSHHVLFVERMLFLCLADKFKMPKYSKGISPEK